MAVTAKDKEQYEHAQSMIPEIVYMLVQTDIRVLEICEKCKVSRQSVYRIARTFHIDMGERCSRTQHRVRTASSGAKKKPKPRQTLYSRIPESLTADGLSLEWLSKAW